MLFFSHNQDATMKEVDSYIKLLQPDQFLPKFFMPAIFVNISEHYHRIIVNLSAIPGNFPGPFDNICKNEIVRRAVKIQAGMIFLYKP